MPIIKKGISLDVPNIDQSNLPIKITAPAKNTLPQKPIDLKEETDIVCFIFCIVNMYYTIEIKSYEPVQVIDTFYQNS